MASSSFQAKASEQRAEATREDIVLAADIAFYNALEAQATLQVAESTVNARRTVSDQIDALTASNLKSTLDQSFAQVDLSQAKLLDLDSQNQFDAATADLNEVLGTTNDQQYTLVDDPSPPQPVATSAEAVITLALQQRPDLLALKLNHEADLRFSRAQHEQLLLGANPYSSGVILDNNGNLYGTAWDGGANGYGAVFKLSPEGTNWTETVLYSFGSYQGDGLGPFSGVIMDAAVNLYGTTSSGSNGVSSGTVFELSPSGEGWTEQVIYTVGIGEGIQAGLTMDAAGDIFGASSYTAFELSPKRGGWKSHVIHKFHGYPHDGSLAYGTPVLDQEGNLYGTTFMGGKDDYGTVYTLSRNKHWKEKILHSFRGGPKDGYFPHSAITFDAAGNIYVTTSGTTQHGFGTIFELVAPVGKVSSYKEKLIQSFNKTDGASPVGSLILDSAGNLYGTTISGGSNGFGVVFEITP